MNKFIQGVKENKLGTVTITVSLAYMFLGLPTQIWKIWETRSVADISATMFTLLLVQSFFWVLYGFQKKDGFIIVPNVAATLFSFIILFEWWMFR